MVAPPAPWVGPCGSPGGHVWWGGAVWCRRARRSGQGMGIRLRRPGWGVRHCSLSFVDGAVVLAAEQHQVIQRRAAAVGPVLDVMSVCPLWTPIAAGVGTTAVTDDQRRADGWRDQPRPPAHVERLALRTEKDAGEGGITGEPPGRVGTQDRAPDRLRADQSTGPTEVIASRAGASRRTVARAEGRDPGRSL